MARSTANHQTVHTRRRSNIEGFTLLELLVVLAILALIAAVAGPRVIGYLGKAKSETARVQLNNIESAIELYFLDNATYPVGDAGLTSLLTAPANAQNWNGPYLKKAKGLTDPWGRPYGYQAPGEHGDFDVYSLGRDGVLGGTGEDKDITSW